MPTDGDLRCVLVTPISPQESGNGLAHRCRFWQGVLARLGTVSTVVVPVSGRPHEGDEAVGLPTVEGGTQFPTRARRAPEHLGRAWRAAADAQADLVLALRSDVAAFALGAAAVDDAVVIVDLDDDDAALFEALGQPEEAARAAWWRSELEARADLLLSADGFGATVRVPNAVRVPAGVRTVPDDPCVLMVGNFTYAPNVRGASWFLEEVLPAITAAVPAVATVLAGPGSERFEGHGVGFVDDLEELHRRASVAVVPLLEGSGTRIKALDAFAHGVPVVGTTIGLAGLGVVPGVHAEVADAPSTFADAVVRLLTDPGAGSGLVAEAQQLVGRYEVRAVAAVAVRLLEEAMTRREPTLFARAPELIVTEEPDGVVVVDEVSMDAHHLNELPAAVFLLVEAPSTLEAIAAALADVVERPIEEVRGPVTAAVSALVGAGLLLPSHGRQRR